MLHIAICCDRELQTACRTLPTNTVSQDLIRQAPVLLRRSFERARRVRWKLEGLGAKGGGSMWHHIAPQLRKAGHENTSGKPRRLGLFQKFQVCKLTEARSGLDPNRQLRTGENR